ncbi:head decoration protein [Paraburkholderia sp. EG304]|uniref:head decoration protein n=1 Tax=Paraburkholderia sp. EG304 TaxID=3237015 RepID=UPI00397DFA4E
MGAPTVPPLNEQWHSGGFLVSEANGHLSRDQVTLTGGVQVLAGTVLGKVTASGFFAPLNPTASDGSQIAAAISYATHDVTTANKPATIIDRNAEVNASELIWPANVTPAQIATATQQLATVGVILR